MSPPLPVLDVIGHSSRDKLTFFFFSLPFLGPETFSHSSACLTSCSATVDSPGSQVRPQGHIREPNALSPPCAPVRTAVSAWSARSLAHGACVHGAPEGVPEDPRVRVLNPSDVGVSTRM